MSSNQITCQTRPAAERNMRQFDRARRRGQRQEPDPVCKASKPALRLLTLPGAHATFTRRSVGTAFIVDLSISRNTCTYTTYRCDDGDRLWTFQTLSLGQRWRTKETVDTPKDVQVG